MLVHVLGQRSSRRRVEFFEKFLGFRSTDQFGWFAELLPSGLGLLLRLVLRALLGRVQLVVLRLGDTEEAIALHDDVVQRAADDCGVRLVLHCTDGQQRVNRDPQKRQLQPSP